MNTKRKYLIIGKSGFIGSYILNAISELPNTEFFPISSEDCNLLDPIQTSNVISPISKDAVVIYSAGITRLHSDSGNALTDNLTMLYNLIKVFQKSKPNKIIFFSSVEIYGIPDKIPITEDTELKPETLYGVGKITAELMLRRFYRQNKVPVAFMRLPGVYGSGDNGFGFIGALIKSIDSKNEFNLVGGGVEKRDYVYVEDIAKIAIALSNIDFKELTLNIATGCSTTISNIIKKVFSLYGECDLKHSPQIQKVCHLQFDTSALKSYIPQLTMTSLEDGLKKYK